MARLLLAAGLLVCLAAGAAQAWPKKSDQSIEAQLARWVRQRGGKLKGFKIGQECDTCIRGIIATRDFEPDDFIMKVPFDAVLRLKDLDHQGFAAEHARGLLDSLHNDPTFNETWGLFWSAHPDRDGTFTPEVYTDEHIEMLQTPMLADLAKGQRAATHQIYDGSYQFQEFNPFWEVVPKEKVGLDTFCYVASLLGSRYFGFFRDGNQEMAASHLVPIVDLINHSDDPNAERGDDGDNVIVKAIKPIKAGQEITNSYQPGVIHRPDMSLYIYGFVIYPRDPPLMAAVDLPTFDSRDPFGQTALDDSIYDDPKSEWVSREEYERLKALLQACPTSEEQDEALLEGGTVTDWRLRSILQFRIMRKRALRRSMAKIAAELGFEEGPILTGVNPPPAEEVEDDDEEDDTKGEL